MPDTNSTNGASSTVSSGFVQGSTGTTWYTWPYVDQRMIDALERIANALERMSVPTPRCSICGNYSEWYITAPYGSDRDGDIICASCLDKALKA